MPFTFPHFGPTKYEDVGPAAPNTFIDKLVYRDMFSRLGLMAAALLPVCALLACAPEAIPKPDMDDTAGTPSTELDYISDLMVIQATDVSCGVESDELALDFLLLDENGAPVAPDDDHAFRSPVVINGPDANLEPSSVSFDDVVLFSTPRAACSSSGDCAEPALCTDISPTTQFEVNLECGYFVELETVGDRVAFTEGRGASHSILLLMDHSQSLEGVNPDGSFNAGRSTDPQNKRISAAVAFVRALDRYLGERNWEVCVAAVHGAAEDPIAFLTGDADSCFTDDTSDLMTALNLQTVEESGDSPIWAGLVQGLDAIVARNALQRSVLLFNDGPDDASEGTAVATARSSALGAGVEIHVIQLDNPPREDDGSKPRLGPLSSYADLACETGGAFQYARNPDDLALAFGRVTAAVAAKYRVVFSRPADISLETGTYRLAGEIRVRIGGTSISAELGGDIVDPTTLDEVDSRLVVFDR